MSDAEILSLVQTEDLVKFGLITEFIGRFGNIVVLEPLTTDDLVSILVETKDSVLQKHKTLFALHGIELVFAPEAVVAIASQAMKLQTGARGLNRIVKDYLLEWEYQLPELAAGGVCQITIDEYALWEGQPTFRYADGDRDRQLMPLQQLTVTDDRLIDRSTILVDGKHFTNTAGWSEVQFRTKLEEVKLQIGWADTTGSAKKWWYAFEVENRHRMGLVLRLAEELLWRKATIVEFFLAYIYSNTDNIQANLYYLDYTRLKKEEERRKKQELSQSDEPELEQQTANSSYRVVLTKIPLDRKIAVLRVVRDLTDLSLKAAKDLIESVPPIILDRGVSAETAQNYVQRLVEVGVNVTVQTED